MSLFAQTQYMETVVIPQGATRSSGINVGSAAPRGIYVPAGFTGAAITFEASPNGNVDAEYMPVRDASGALLSLTVPAGGSFIGFYPDALAGLGWMRLVVAAQTAGVTVKLVLKP